MELSLIRRKRKRRKKTNRDRDPSKLISKKSKKWPYLRNFTTYLNSVFKKKIFSL
jgi:hypothetical protein